MERRGATDAGSRSCDSPAQGTWLALGRLCKQKDHIALVVPRIFTHAGDLEDLSVISVPLKSNAKVSGLHTT